MAINRRRGGLGTNQYSVKPLSQNEEIDLLDSIDALRKIAKPSSLSKSRENGTDPQLNDMIVRYRNSDSDEDRQEIVREMQSCYPPAYVRALIQSDDLQEDATDEYEMNISEIESEILSYESGENMNAEDTAKLSALIVVTSRDIDNRANNLDEINKSASQKNKSFIDSLPF